MNFKIIKQETNYIEFILSGTEIDTAFVNFFRHIITNYIPIYAIDTVDFFTHESQIFPMQFISHRIGQLPIKYSKNTPEWLFLDIKNTGKDILTIYSNDIEPKDHIVFSQIPLLKLGSNEHIQYACKIRKSIGAEHVKWSPVTIATFEETKNGEFYFKIESVGQIPIKKLIKMTFKQMILYLKGFKEQLKDIEPIYS